MTDYSDVYNITLQPSQNRIIIKFYSHLMPGAHKQFTSDIVASVKKMAVQGNRVDLLFDLLESSVQTKEIAEDNSWVYALGNDIRRSAIILTSPTYKSQLNRMATKTLPENKHLHFFDNIVDAEQWLKETN